MSVLAAASRVAFLADPTDVGDETHKAGPIAVVVIVVLCIACFVLFRSMSKHMRRVREQFPTDDPVQAGEDPGPEQDAASAEQHVDAEAPTPTASATAPAATVAASRPAPKSRAHPPEA